MENLITKSEAALYDYLDRKIYKLLPDNDLSDNQRFMFKPYDLFYNKKLKPKYFLKFMDNALDVFGLDTNYYIYYIIKYFLISEAALQLGKKRSSLTFDDMAYLSPITCLAEFETAGVASLVPIKVGSVKTFWEKKNGLRFKLYVKHLSGIYVDGVFYLKNNKFHTTIHFLPKIFKKIVKVNGNDLKIIDENNFTYEELKKYICNKEISRCILNLNNAIKDNYYNLPILRNSLRTKILSISLVDNNLLVETKTSGTTDKYDELFEECKVLYELTGKILSSRNKDSTLLCYIDFDYFAIKIHDKILKIKSRSWKDY